MNSVAPKLSATAPPRAAALYNNAVSVAKQESRGPAATGRRAFFGALSAQCAGVTVDLEPRRFSNRPPPWRRSGWRILGVRRRRCRGYMLGMSVRRFAMLVAATALLGRGWRGACGAAPCRRPPTADQADRLHRRSRSLAGRRRGAQTLKWDAAKGRWGVMLDMQPARHPRHDTATTSRPAPTTVTPVAARRRRRSPSATQQVAPGPKPNTAGRQPAARAARDQVQVLGFKAVHRRQTDQARVLQDGGPFCCRSPPSA